MESAEPPLFWCDRRPIIPVLHGTTDNSTGTPPLNDSQIGNDTAVAGGFTDLSSTIDGILGGPVLATICIFGIFGNGINLLVLSRKAMIKEMERMEKSAHMGLIALAIADMLFCASALPSCFIKTDFLTAYQFQALYLIYHEGLINMFLLASTWLTVTMAVSRYVAICHPLKARLLIGMSFAKVAVVLVFILSVIFNIPRFLEKAPRSLLCVEGRYMYYWVPGILYPTLRPKVKLAYQWLYFLLGILLPFLLMLFCNARLIRALKNSRKMSIVGSKHNRSAKNASQTRRVTLTLVSIVVMYLVLVSPAEMNTFLRKMALHNTDKIAWYNITISVLNTLQSINFAFNFVLYCAVNTYFRRTMREIFCKCTGIEHRRLKSFQSMTNGTKQQYSTRQSQTYISEMSTVM